MMLPEEEFIYLDLDQDLESLCFDDYMHCLVCSSA
jgi:hypothetical protein